MEVSNTMLSNDEFRAIFNFANEAIIIADYTGKIIKVNPSAETLFGHPSEQFIQLEINDIIPNRYQHSHDQHIKNYQKNAYPRKMGAGRDLWAIKSDGTEFPVEISLSPINIQEIRYVVAFIIDISIRKKAEEQSKNYQIELEKEVEERTLILREAIKNLEQTKLKLDNALKKERELNQLKSKFISIASHEFRTPLATILSSLSLVEKYIALKEDEKRIKHIDRIKKSVKNLTEILDDILSVNRIEEGKVIINPTRFNLSNFLNEILSEVRLLAKKGQTMELKMGSGIDVILQDPKLLRHIMLNLLSNAIKFSDEGQRIRIETKSKNENIYITVSDDGIGIPEKDQGALFTRFFRSENAGQIQGTGLGLSIVSHYTKLMKGIVNFKSTVGKGSSFEIIIPQNYNNITNHEENFIN